jgi:hypothetical protein
MIFATVNKWSLAIIPCLFIPRLVAVGTTRLETITADRQRSAKAVRRERNRAVVYVGVGVIVIAVVLLVELLGNLFDLLRV